jgi:hypothetical protein
LDDNRLVYVERAYVLEPFTGPVNPMSSSLTVMDESALDAGESVPELSGSLSGTTPSAAMQAYAVPEPPTMVLAAGALALLYILKPNKIR